MAPSLTCPRRKPRSCNGRSPLLPPQAPRGLARERALAILGQLVRAPGELRAAVADGATEHALLGTPRLLGRLGLAER